ncbi:RebB family R body protein [Sphingomonas sp. LB-2]|uniref:RebB family R body protein n=1 Tax=Sphingomonas caeni TaxID=2984949 RepID=UPI002231BA7F|nr:RebB family R body protein [Sphingomonas caeni]MCW3849315.1 RebB family R body protein [Sphingomonas caeni]
MASDDILADSGCVDPVGAISRALAMAALNATAQQQQIATSAQASTTMGVATLYSVDTATLGIASKKLLDK